MTIADLLFDNDEQVNYPILSTFDADYTFSNIAKNTQRYNKLLSAHGDLRGKKVGLLVPTILDYLSLALAVNQLGGTIIPISWLLRKDDLSGILDLLAPHIIFTINELNDYPFGDVIREWIEKKGLKTVLYRSNDCKEWNVKLLGTEENPLESEQMDFIACTSGSTGVPKGIVMNKSAIEFTLRFMQDRINFKPTDQMLLVAPPTSIFGLVCLFTSFKAKTQVVFPETFDFPKIIKLLKQKPCNKILTTPSIMKAIHALATPSSNILNRLEVCGFTGEIMTPQFTEMFKQTMPNCEPVGIYGSSEIGGAMYCDLRGKLEWTLDDEIEWKIDGEPKQGELLLRTPGAFTNYYKRPDLTSETLDAEGWYVTGDIVRVNENDKFEIIGRKKDMIKKGGQQIIPGEIEHVLVQHPNVKQAVVVGVPHRVFGEQVVAFVIPSGNFNMQNLYSFCKERVAAYKIPDQIELIDQMPMNLGKVDKLTLKNRFSNK